MINVMFSKDNCSNSTSWAERKLKYQNRKLRILNFIKESYERKLAAVTASISKLEEQINSNIIQD